MLETVRLHELMTDYAMKCGIGYKNWSKLLNNCDKWREERRTYVAEFIKRLYENEWAALDKARKQMCATDDMWENMDLLFDGGFPEQIVVKKSMKAMKARWIRFKEDYKSLRQQLKIDNQT